MPDNNPPEATGRANILLTGGAGYLGSHTYVALWQAGFQPVILDDFSNSDPAILKRLQHITGAPTRCQRGSVADTGLVAELIKQQRIQAVMHFAGFKAVGESVEQPLKYYSNNLGGMLSLLKAMQESACQTLVFSSSATVYGDSSKLPITEDCPRSHTSPYGHTKLICEDMIAALQRASGTWRTGVLRYFNPVGAHPSGLIGEAPLGTPVVARCPGSLRRAAQATWRVVTPTRAWPNVCWLGAPSTPSQRCAQMPGAGKRAC